MKIKPFFCFLSILIWGLSPLVIRAQELGNSLYRIEEITIPAGEFSVVGDLYIPLKGEKHPAAVWVHGSGPLTRQIMAPLLKPQIEIFLKAGFAFFLDDIPGAGGSTGEIKSVYQDRALILAGEIAALKKRFDILPGRIGMVGMSQAGIVMPMASTLTTDISFMIAEACVAESAYRQDAYLLEKLMICEGRPAEEAQKAARFQRERYETMNYPEYLAAVEFLDKNEYSVMIGQNDPGMSEEKFKLRDRSPAKLGSFYDPMPVVSGLRFPILALFGEKDHNINLVQGYDAYRLAFQKARNPLNQVEMIPNANHSLYEAETGCVRELMAQVTSGKPLYGPQVLNIISAWLDKLKASFQL